MIPLLLCALAWIQDPAPSIPEILPDFPETPIAPPVDWQAELMEKIDKVREGFSALDQDLLEARTIADEATNDQEIQPWIDRAQEDGATLLANLEDLLASIPEQDASQSQSGGSSQQPSPSPTRPEDAQQNQQGDPQEPSNGQESEDGNLPPNLPQGALLFDESGGAWGGLPPRLQQALENASLETMPLRYRKWMREFHRRQTDSREP